MNHRQIVILGSTGSIGKSTLDVIRQHPGRFIVRALAAYRNVELLVEQYRQFRPDYLGIVDHESGVRLKELLKSESVKILVGEEDVIKLASLESTDLVLNAIVGAAGLRASVEAIKSGRNLALANKESLVAGGPLFTELMKQSGAQILPIDSEHSAIWQALRAGGESELRRIILTSSGGPFRTLPAEKFSEITVEQALDHPTWNMGAKITIDSATLANKGLEVLEAVVLFSVPPEKIEVVIHPQSIIHSAVEFCDSSVIAQMSLPDMRLPITYALFWPERVTSPFGQIDWSSLKELTFEPPDFDRFGALKLAFEVAGTGGTAPAVYNAANEVAVEAFLNRAIKFPDIADILRQTVEESPVAVRPDLDEILKADHRAREFARKVLERVA